MNPSFGAHQAASYDEGTAKLAPLKEILHYSASILLAHLPSNAEVLVLGAGTGQELCYLAQRFSNWRFTVLEPSSAMLGICRQKCTTHRFEDRCLFAECYLDALETTTKFDAATAILVSQFILIPEERKAFFQRIAEHLKPGAPLITADLAANQNQELRTRDVRLWMRLMTDGAPIELEQAQYFMQGFSQGVALSSAQEIEELLTDSGFDQPDLFLKNFLIHAWVTHKSS